MLPEGAAPSVSLLVIDAEGHDLHVLQQYPFASVPTWRVIYESTHLSDDDVVRAARLMRAHGYVSLLAPLSKSPYAVWHRNESSEALKRGRRWRGVRRRGGS